MPSESSIKPLPKLGRPPFKKTRKACWDKEYYEKLSAFLEQHYNDLLTYATTLVDRELNDAKDLVQSLCEELLRGRSRLRFGENPLRYAKRMMQTIKYTNSTSRQELFEQGKAWKTVPAINKQGIQVYDADQQPVMCRKIEVIREEFPEDDILEENMSTYAERVLREEQLEALATLTPRQLEVIQMTVFDGLTMRSTAEMMGISKSRVQQIHTAALRKLKLFFESGH